MMVSVNFLPQITMPTRFSKNNCTLIDQIYVKQSFDDGTLNQSLVLLSALSDHLCCIAQICPRKKQKANNKFTKIRKMDQKSIEAFANDIRSTNFQTMITNDLDCDPNINYNTIHNFLNETLNKHMPIKSVKYNKYKHKKSEWMTDGILISIKYRDRLYKKMKMASTEREHEHVSINFKTYNNILKKTIREAKYVYYHNQFN